MEPLLLVQAHRGSRTSAEYQSPKADEHVWRSVEKHTGGTPAIYHLHRTIRHILTKDNTHVYTMEMISDEYLIRLSLVHYSTCFTDNKVLVWRLHQRKHFLKPLTRCRKSKRAQCIIGVAFSDDCIHVCIFMSQILCKEVRLTMLTKLQHTKIYFSFWMISTSKSSRAKKEIILCTKSVVAVTKSCFLVIPNVSKRDK